MLCHDPRISNDREHKVETTNPALIMAEMLRQQYETEDGRAAGWQGIRWDYIAEQANIADEPVELIEPERPEAMAAIRIKATDGEPE